MQERQAERKRERLATRVGLGRRFYAWHKFTQEMQVCKCYGAESASSIWR
jgi:hypothetical protein